MPARIGGEVGTVHRERIPEVELAGPEIFVLHTGIEVWREREAQPGNTLIGPGTVLASRVTGPGAARAAADIAAKPTRPEIAVEQRVRHQLGDADMISSRKVRSGNGRP